MSTSEGYLALLQDLLSPLGAIRVRRMFGGAGVYCDGQVFAFIDDEKLFLKTDEAGRAAFEAEGMGPFTYKTKNGPGTLMSYYRAPDRLLDEPDELQEWAHRAIGVARREAGSKARSGSGKAKRPRPKKVAVARPKRGQ